MCTTICDYSLQAITSRPAVVGEKLVTHNFGLGTRGFAPISRDADNPVAVCLLPGSEVAFDQPLKAAHPVWCLPTDVPQEEYPSVAVFAQKDKDRQYAHHDCLQFADGRQVLLTCLAEGQTCTVLQLPAKPKTVAEAEAQKRIAFAG